MSDITEVTFLITFHESRQTVNIMVTFTPLGSPSAVVTMYLAMDLVAVYLNPNRIRKTA